MRSKFQQKNGLFVNIEINDDDYIATVFTQGGLEIGSLEFIYIEDEFSSACCLKLTHAFLDKLGRQHLNQGIGGECLRLMNQYTGFNIICSSPYDPTQQDDGSHLTGDAPGFAQAMKKKGLLWFSEE